MMEELLHLACSEGHLEIVEYSKRLLILNNRW